MSVTFFGNKQDDDSTTKSGISEGTIEIRDEKKQKQDIEDLNRDTINTNDPLDKIFDKDKILEKEQAAKLFGEIGFELIGDLAAKQKDKYRQLALNESDPEKKAYYLSEAEKWNDGGEYKILLHGLAGGLMSEIGNGDFGEGIAVGSLNEILIGALDKKREELKLSGEDYRWASTILGGIVRGNQGAGIADTATTNNRLDEKHYSYISEKAWEIYSEGLTNDEEMAAMGGWEKYDGVWRRILSNVQAGKNHSLDTDRILEVSLYHEGYRKDMNGEWYYSPPVKSNTMTVSDYEYKTLTYSGTNVLSVGATGGIITDKYGNKYLVQGVQGGAGYSAIPVNVSAEAGRGYVISKENLPAKELQRRISGLSIGLNVNFGVSASFSISNTGATYTFGGTTLVGVGANITFQNVSPIY